MGAAVSLDALRARIRAIEGDAHVERRRVASGVPLLEELVGGLPCPGILEISGPPGSGRTRLALMLVAAMAGSSRGLPVAWVDPAHQLYPPAAAALGVPLDRLLLIRPPAVGLAGADALHPEVWTMEQLLRSGCFPLVVLAGVRALPRASGQVWARAAERGQCTAVVITDRPARQLPADVRLTAAPGLCPQVRVLRDRGGRPGGAAALPWPEGLSPWA